MAKRNLKLTPSTFFGEEGREAYLAAKADLQKAQEAYDTTPAGIAELVRRAAYHSGKTKTEYELRLERGRALRTAMLLAAKAKDLGDIRHKGIPKLAEYKNGEFLHDDQVRETVGNNSPEILTMIEESKQWVNNLTTEETEAVAWFTSNGSLAVNQHLTDQEISAGGNYTKKHLDATVKSMDSALAKFKRDKPVVVYRGVSMNIMEAQGYGRDAESFAKEAFPLGGNYKSDAFMSTSLDPSRATGFAVSGIILEIKTRKAAPVVNVSAWDITEKEMIIPRDQEYKVVGIIKNPKIEGREDLDNMIIQLEEI